MLTLLFRCSRVCRIAFVYHIYILVYCLHHLYGAASGGNAFVEADVRIAGGHRLRCTVWYGESEHSINSILYGVIWWVRALLIIYYSSLLQSNTIITATHDIPKYVIYMIYQVHELYNLLIYGLYDLHNLYLVYMIYIRSAGTWSRSCWTVWHDEWEYCVLRLCYKTTWYDISVQSLVDVVVCCYWCSCSCWYSCSHHDCATHPL